MNHRIAKAILTLSLVTFAYGIGYTQDITGNVFGKGLRVMAKDSSIYMKFGVRFSTLYEGFYNATPRTMLIIYQQEDLD